MSMKKHGDDAGMPDKNTIHIPEGNARAVLQAIWKAFAGQPFDEDALVMLKIPPLSGAEVMAAFIELRAWCMIHTVKNNWDERLFFISEEVLLKLQDLFFRLPPHWDQIDAPILKREAGVGLAKDLFHVLVYMHQQEGLTLTTKGTVHKRQITKLEALDTGLRNEDAQGLGLHHTHAEVYTPAVAVLIDLTLALGLVIQLPGRLVLNMDSVLEWLHLSEDHMNALLFQHVMQRYGNQESDHQHFRALLCRCDVPVHSWLDLDALLREMTSAGMVKQERLGMVNKAAATWVQFLAGAGWADCGQSGDGSLLVRFRVSGCCLMNMPFQEEYPSSLEGGLYVQPDYEILVPPETPYQVLWELCRCADYVAGDRMMVYRLSKTSVTSATYAGFGVEKILTLLGRHAVTGIPEHVVDAVMLWGREAALSAPSKTVVKPEELNAPSVLQGDLQRFKGHQRMEGSFLPRAGLIGGMREYGFLELDDEVPDGESLFPGIQLIPRSWTSELRGYHASTSRQIVETALGWRAALEIRKNGQNRKFIPLTVQRDPWIIEGELYELEQKIPVRVELGDGDWQELRILLPAMPNSRSL
ncbi:helicase-associated domain-containing protein [Paenibacillus lemnae]|uniref:Helicase XPB/Ssl2 N-terminal domain-containing protein n=1 Tax=Paenibacillus lemnae TaxID=1330551 RepID=A0A848M162_PAELE|nr:helicase-associated domain-containing protein [Paenibacillus lemnae]NMO94668.1 hypothetical protein [Paenibacillus lemnae]